MSSAVSRLQASLAQATNEVTVAAANLNFDFTLVKVEAPKEYAPLGQLITSSRKQNAEGGEAHITARRLGALFEGICPDCRELLKAFGTRASEISKSAPEMQKSGLAGSKWIFSDYAGIDATTLWAAATSSKAAIPTYLLALMLARAWPEAEATSIWVEIVAERRREVASKFEDGEPVQFKETTAAAQAEITREQLERWDASARAWLATADRVKIFQHKQLMLIIKEISIEVSKRTSTYQSVIAAWVSALEALNKVVAGAPLAISDGAVLVALSAWHLYPDMIVFGGASSQGRSTGAQKVEMKDALIKDGGDVTLGASRYQFDGSNAGVYWSLSLAHHRFYGRSVEMSGQVGSSGDRITCDEFLEVIIGVILSHWSIRIEKTSLALQLLMEIMLCSSKDPQGWTYWDNADILGMLKMAVARLIKQPNHGTDSPFLNLGRRRRRFMLDTESRHQRYGKQPFFGLTSISVFLQAMNGPEGRLALLRRLAARTEGLEELGAVIVYNSRNEREVSNNHAEMDFATAFPTLLGFEPLSSDERNSCTQQSRTARPSSSGLPRHRRWVADIETASSHVGTASEVVSAKADDSLTHSMMSTAISINTWNMGTQPTDYDFFFGDKELAALFVRRSRSWKIPIPATGQSLTVRRRPMAPTVTPEDILWAFQHHLIEPYLLNQIFRTGEDSPVLQMLWYAEKTQEVYSSLTLQGATISAAIFQQPFHLYTYSRSSRNHQRAVSALQIIAYMETGENVVRDQNLGGCIGLSFGDSIYVQDWLLNDPTARVRSDVYARILGNFAHPGLVFITCTPQPEVRPGNPGSWRKLVPTRFDGRQEDCFSDTSLHLSFTDWKSPLLQSRSIGNRTTPANLLETTVSVRDGGEWVADIDFHSYRRNGAVHQILPGDLKCTHQTPQPPLPEWHWQSIESWDQVLDCDEGVSITRSAGNWVARSALAGVFAQHCNLHNKRILVCRSDTCWQCLWKYTIEGRNTNVIIIG